MDKWKKEEAERQRLMKIAIEAENKLTDEYDRLEADEAERQRLLKQREQENTVPEHWIQGKVEYSGASDKQVNDLCQELFNTPPIPFIPKRNDKVDLEVKRLIDEMGVTIPIVWIKDSLYLVGSSKVHLEKKGNKVTAQIGGGYQELEQYLPKNHNQHEKDLILKMVQSKMSLEGVCETIIEGKKIQTVQYQNIDNTPGSPSRNQRLYIERKKVMSIKRDGTPNNALVVNLYRRPTVGGANSPVKGAIRNASPVGRRSQMVGNKTQSPMTGASRRNYDYKSPMSARSRRSGQSPGPQGMDLYRGQKQYEERKSALLRQIDNTRAERKEHEEQQNQTQK